jgi:type IV pilus assembly protein PilM
MNAYLNFKRSAVMIGLDISDTCIKLVLLKSNKANYKLTGVYKTLIQNEMADGIRLNDIDYLGHVLKQLLKTNQIKTKKVATSVAPSNVFTTVISMDAQLDQDQIEEQLIFEADQYVPYNINEVLMDFQVLGTSLEKPDHQDVLLVTTHNEPVANLKSVISAAGLKPVIMDVHQYVVLRMHENFRLHQYYTPQKQSCVVYIEISAYVTRMVFIYEGKVINTDEQRFTHRVENLVDLEEHMSWFKRTIQIFSANHDGLTVEAVLIFGDRAGLKGINEELALCINKPVYTVNPFFDLAYDLYHSIAEPYRYMIATGLALREAI